MPIDYNKYPANWKTEIVPAVRERSGDCCEWPGCGVPNGSFIVRGEGEKWYDVGGCGAYSDEKVTKIILTVAHLDHDITHNDMSNLAHWCQLHHNRYDVKHRQVNAANTRATKRRVVDANAGQAFLMLEESKP